MTEPERNDLTNRAALMPLFEHAATRTLDLKGRAGDWKLTFVLSSFLAAGLLSCILSSHTLAAAFSMHSISELAALLPVAFVFCFLLGLVSTWSAKESRSVPVDWTETDVLLGTGEKSVSVPWSSINSISQLTDWDIINGKQPAFMVQGRQQAGFRFKLKQSDIMLKHDLESFFSAARAHAPQAQLILATQTTRTDSYTELWLKYFSTEAPRTRTTLLQTNMLLGNEQYEVIGTIGGGGQGTAYLSIYRPKKANESSTMEPISFPNKAQLREQDQVVLKEYVLPVHRGQAIADRTAQKLKSEVEILSRLDHPQIVKLKDAFIEDYRGYLVLEYIFGESLKAVVEKSGAQPEEQVVPWILDVCGIVQYMHGLSPPVVHRDITPDNLMLEPNGTIKLVDFNVAHQVDSSATATVVGKHAYIPPEQFRGKPTPQSDIYALGGTMHFLLTGKDPEPISVSHPRTLNERVSERLDAVVAKATAHKLSDRYADIAEMANALRNV